MGHSNFYECCDLTKKIYLASPNWYFNIYNKKKLFLILSILLLALTIYKSALEYLIPLITNEKNPGKKLNLRKKADQYILRAEMIKKQLGYTNLEAGSTLESEY